VNLHATPYTTDFLFSSLHRFAAVSQTKFEKPAYHSKFRVKNHSIFQITMKQFIFATARNLGTHPVPVTIGSFGVFLSFFAAVDYNRDMTGVDFSNFKKRDSEHLGESLEQLHSRAFRELMTYDNIRVNRFRSEELYFLFLRAKSKKEELKKDAEFKTKNDEYLEGLVASEYYSFAQRICRRSMIRNMHFVKWFKATMHDEVIKYYVLPIVGFFGARYFKIFDSKSSPK
jgi:hypothetical protein